MEHDKYMQVRAELTGLVDAMQAAWAHGDGSAFLARLNIVRAEARRHHFHAVVDLLGALEQAAHISLMRADGGRAISGYLDRIGDAVGCAEADPAMCEAILASVAVRQLGC